LFFSGVLVAYLTLKELDKTNGKIKLVMYYVHRYLRLTIPLALIIAFVIAFLPSIALWLGSQAAYGIAMNQAISCKAYGWSILIYLNNFLRVETTV